MFAFKGRKSDSYAEMSTVSQLDVDTQTVIKTIKKIVKKNKKKSADHKELGSLILKVLKGKACVDDVDQNGNSVLLRVIDKFSYIDAPIVLRCLLPMSSDLNIRNNNNGSYLFLKMLMNYSKMKSDVELVYEVMNRTDPNITNGSGNTPLMSAIISYRNHQDMGIVTNLIEKSDLSEVNNRGECAMHLAIVHFMDHRSEDMIRTLVDRTNFTEIDSHEVLHEALTRVYTHQTDNLVRMVLPRCDVTQSVVSSLLSYCDSVSRIRTFVNPYGPSLGKHDRLDILVPLFDMVIARAKKCNNELNLNAIDIKENSLMNYACEIGSIDMIRVLRKNGVSLNSRFGKLMPLESAVMTNQIDAVQYLLRKDADPNLHKSQLPCLFNAIVNFDMGVPKYGGVELIQSLLDNGADPNAQIVTNNILIPITLLCILRTDWFDVMKRLVSGGLRLSNSMTDQEKMGTGLRFLLIRQSLSYEKQSISLEGFDTIYLKMNDLLNRVIIARIKPKEFADYFFDHTVDTSLSMLSNGDTIMHFIIKMIIKKQLLPSCILKLKEHDSVLAIDVKNDSLQTPIDLIVEAMSNRELNHDTGVRLKRELMGS
jgi:ankyrin repeat protein